jgi:thymidylate kinase
MLVENKPVSVVSFEGPHRVGKGQNIKLLSQYLSEKNIPHVVLKGDGSRSGEGQIEGDPESLYWQKLSSELRNSEVPKEMWNYAAYLLSREFLVWKNVYMPRKLNFSNSHRGLIILDRSILSRTLIPRELTEPSKWSEEIPNTLYKKPDNWKGKQIDLESVTPDLVFSLHAPLNVLLERLDKDDPKYEFRKRNLIDRYNWYIDSVNYIPKELETIIVSVDTNRQPDKVFSNIKKVLLDRLELQLS